METNTRQVDRFVQRQGVHRTFFGPLSPERSATKARMAWSSARQRCTNANIREFRTYGALGISMCADWLHDFDAFVAHVGYPIRGELSLDRIDNDGDYEPGNVKWSTFAEQQANRGHRAVRS